MRHGCPRVDSSESGAHLADNRRSASNALQLAKVRRDASNTLENQRPSCYIFFVEEVAQPGLHLRDALLLSRDAIHGGGELLGEPRDRWLAAAGPHPAATRHTRCEAFGALCAPGQSKRSRHG